MITKDIFIRIGLCNDCAWLDMYVKLINDNEFTEKLLYITQCHHIIPKYYYEYNSVEVDNSKSNLVNLKYSDHVKAHYYLEKCSTDTCRSKSYASIAYILRHRYCKVDDDILYVLNDLDAKYVAYRHMLAEKCKTPEALQKKAAGQSAYWRYMKTYDYERYNELCIRRSKALTGVPKSESHRKKVK